jgi:hypothetical protein
MPIEIRELQIVAVVNEDKNQQQQRQQQPAANTNNGPDTERIIAECVEQVLEILKEKNER